MILKKTYQIPEMQTLELRLRQPIQTTSPSTVPIYEDPSEPPITDPNQVW